MSSKLLFETGFSFNRERYDNVYQPGIGQVYGSAAWLAGARKSDNSTGLLWNASSAQLGNYPDKYNASAAVSYVTGSHNVKVGFVDQWGPYYRWNTANADLYQVYNAGVPLYVIYGGGRAPAPPRVLPQILSESTLIEAVEKL